MDLNKLKQQLVRHEGVVPYAYPDSTPSKYLTIGVGHLVDQRLGAGLDSAVIDLQLSLDIEKTVSLAKTYSWFDSLSDPRQNVILNMLFNLGKTRFDRFVNLQKALSIGDWEKACHEMEYSLWYQQVGKRGKELVKQMRDDVFV